MNYSEQIAKLSEWIRSRESLCIELQTILIAHPACGPESGGDGEWEKADALKQWLKKRGIAVNAEYDIPDNRVSSRKRPAFSLRIAGKNPDRRLWILSHLDIVPSGDTTAWSSDPFTASVRDGKIYGRGSEDNHHGIVMSILAFLAFHESGIIPPLDIMLLFVGDEELSSQYGIAPLLDRNIFRKSDFFLVPDGGDLSGTGIEIAEKSIYWYRFSVTGVQGHASEPEKGKNALAAASALVLGLERLHALFPEADPLFDPPHSTFVPTRHEENQQNINTIPGRDIFYLDCRVLPGIHKAALEDRISAICRETEKEYDVTVSYSLTDSYISGKTDEHCLPVRMLGKAIELTRGSAARLYGHGGGTMAAFLRNRGFDAVVWSTIAGMAHMPDEYCIIENCLADARTLAAFTVFLQE
ncbi:MAG: M20 family metallo-hydrolase [Spirochaetales bacterium]|nr:M20 family metallo-hydrolase [Spirochaetales bacterium]